MKLSSESQDILKGMAEDKVRLRSRATEKYYEQIFEEIEGAGRKEIKRGFTTCGQMTLCGDIRMKEMK